MEELTGQPRDRQSILQSQRLHALLDGLAIHLLQVPSDDGAWAIEIVESEIARITRTESV